MSDYFDRIRFAQKLGGHLRSLREDAGKTQTLVGDKLGVSGSAWSRVESGVTTITLWDLTKVCSFLGADLNQLVKDIGKK